MSEHELEKLLGGFAADTLTEAERQALYKAALTDQTLFNALADEQALKELLGEPAARRRILAALEEATVTGSVAAAASLASKPLAWSAFEWFRRPTHVALAGSLAAGLFAVVLGTRIYQDNLKQVAEPAATEQPQITAPPQPTLAPPPPTADLSRMEESRSGDQLASSPPAKTGKRAIAPPTTAAQPIAPSQERDKAKSTSLAPAPAPMPTMKDTATGAPATEPVSKQSPVGQSDERQPAQKQDQLERAAGRAEALREAPPALSLPAPPPVESATPPSPFASALSAKPGSGARDLFYKNVGEPLVQPERRAKMPETEEAASRLGAMADAPQKEMKRADHSPSLFGKLEGGKKTGTQPIGLRYSLIIAGPGGIDLEVDPTTPMSKDDGPRMTVEANEDGYLSVLYQEQNGRRTMLFPSASAGSESAPARIEHRKRFLIPLTGLFEKDPPPGELRLMILFSRESHAHFGSRMSGARSTPGLLIERVDPSQPGAPQEHAVYIVNPDSASGTVLVEAPLSLRP